MRSVQHKRADLQVDKRIKTQCHSLIFQASFSDEFGPRQRDGKQDTQFYEDGTWELAKLRAVLCGSYVFGFYIENEKTRTGFESLQTELEEATERLAEVIARLTKSQKIVLI